jgi:flagellar biosynthesis/type III secretory pathway chaperone
MMRSVLHDLKELVEENKKLLAAAELDMEWLQRWSCQRETIFARFKSADFSLPRAEETTAANLIKEILEADAIIITRVKQELVTLEQKITATQNIGRILKANAGSGSPALLCRVA